MTKFSLPNVDKLKNDYEKRKDLYNDLMIRIRNILITEVNNQKIQYLDIYARKQPKEFSSFYDKISHEKIAKDYFENIEDIAGVRLICNYHSELTKIEQVIKTEFQVLRKEHKTFPIGVDPTGYQSDHFIVKLRKSSVNLKDPLIDKRILGLKCEIQTRTILMHAWATVSHHVNYKKERGLGDDFEREMYAISTLFYFADQRFDAYKNLREKKSHISKKQLKLDLDKKITGKSLSEYLQEKFPDREDFQRVYALSLAKQLKKMGYSDLRNIDNKINKSLKVFEMYENDYPPSAPGTKYDGIGILRICLALSDKQNKSSDNFYVDEISKYRKLL